MRDISQGDAATRRAALNSSRNRLSVFDGGVVLLDNLGTVVAAQPAREGILGQDWSDRDYFGSLMTTPAAYFSNTSNDGAFGVKVIVVSVPLLGDGGEFVGALAGMFRLGEPTASSFYASILKLRLGQTGHTYIVDGGDRLLFDSGQSPGERVVGSEVDIQHLAGISIDGSGDAVRTRDSEGHDIVAAYAPVPGTDWTLVTEDDWAALTSQTRPYGQLLVGLLGLGMALPAIGVALLLRERRSQALQRQSTDEDTRLARLIQHRLLPNQVPLISGWNVSLRYRPVPSAGGDFYDLILLPDGRLVIALANISKQGVEAAVAMATTRAAIRSAARRMLSPAEALASTNEILCAELEADDSVRCVYAILDPSSGRLSLGLAGHSPPYTSQLGREQRTPRTTPLGLTLDVQFDQAVTTIEPGGCLAFFSEGVFGASNSRGELLGRDHLINAMDNLAQNGRPRAEDLMEKLSDYLGPEIDQREDLTIITLERLPPGGLTA
jgi:serine phosphatase RsbU (regulator of sigma subunit)